MRNEQDDGKDHSLEGIFLAVDEITGRINKEPSNIQLYCLLHTVAAGSLDLLTKKEEQETEEGKQILGKLGKNYLVSYSKAGCMENLCVSDLRNLAQKKSVREYSIGMVNGEVGYVELRIRDTSTNTTERIYYEGVPDEEGE